jgi:RNAse (barnase) inhibitor barstar
MPQWYVDIYRPSRFGLSNLWHVFMTFIRDPLLVIWEAMNLVSEAADVCSDAAQILKLIAEAEETLFRLTQELARCADFEASIPRMASVALH